MVESFDALVDVALILHRFPAPEVPGAAVLTNSGAMRGVIFDIAEREGLELVEFSKATDDALRAIVPAYMPTDNPFDIATLPFRVPDAWGTATKLLLDEPRAGAARGLALPRHASAAGRADEVRDAAAARHHEAGRLHHARRAHAAGRRIRCRDAGREYPAVPLDRARHPRHGGGRGSRAGAATQEAASLATCASGSVAAARGPDRRVSQQGIARGGGHSDAHAARSPRTSPQAAKIAAADRLSGRPEGPGRLARPQERRRRRHHSTSSMRPPSAMHGSGCTPTSAARGRTCSSTACWSNRWPARALR